LHQIKVKNKMKMKKEILKYALVAGVIALSASCRKEGCTDEAATNYNEEAKKDDGSCVYPAEEDESAMMVSSNITSNTTWTNDKVYILTTRVTVESGATLTIEPGTVIKGEVGTGANATALIIARGGMLMAEGTENSPIIFTSVADEIQPGEIASPNLDPDFDGLWGGLIVLGNAPISADAASVQIEGIPPSDQNGLYGGSDATDNSGVLRYISIRHGGANIGEGNEINGLTCGGVGSGTTIDHIEVIANQDDGVEFFGGSVNASNIIVWNAGDDAIDTDQAWSGTLDNFIVICGAATDHGLEIDGPEGTLLAGHTLQNGSVKGFESSELGDFRDAARGSFDNIYFFNFPDPNDDGRGDLSLSSGSDVTYADGDLSFSGLEVVLSGAAVITDVLKGGTDADGSAVTEGSNTVGADASAFNNWAWASVNGELTDF
jgi:hypothetical protein